eukprot:9764426-Prorocentrum_lima.AAC.1
MMRWNVIACQNWRIATPDVTDNCVRKIGLLSQSISISTACEWGNSRSTIKKLLKPSAEL